MSIPSSAATPWPQLPPGVPIVLLPIRIETLYFEGLRVRIYPDVVHVDSHEPELTEAEIQSGLGYWADVAAAGVDPDRLVAAWSPLAARFGPERAAWIARSTRAGRPTGTPRDAGWTRAPLARLLPTRWHVAGFNWNFYSSTCVFDVAGPEIPRNLEGLGDLAVGPDPTKGLAPTPVPADGTFVDPGMRWMIDYAAAEAVGMAITIPNPREVDRLLVYGVDESMTPEQGQARLTALLEAHYYTDGLGFIDPGTPTNNTSAERSGMVPLSTALSERYRLGDGTATAPPPHSAGSVGADLATALGLAGGAGGVLARDPAGARVDHQAAMNAVVWPSSWGYFLFHILEDVSLEAVRGARRHFIDHVRAGGPLPAIRVGAQPYGVLPVLGIGTSTADAIIGDVQRKVLQYTQVLGLTWLVTANELRDPLTGRPYPPGQTAPPVDPLLRLLRTLALQPRSTRYAGRSMLGPEYISSLWRFLRLGLDDGWRNTPVQMANFTLQDMGLAPDQRQARAVFAEEAFAVPGPIVGPDPRAYLTEILNRTPIALRDTPERGQTPLLYRVARDAALRELWNGLLLVEGGSREYVEDELIDMDDTVSPTLWRGLDRPAPPAHGGPTVTIGQYLDDAARAAQDPGDPNVADLREFRAGVAELATLPAAELDRLLRGSLDLASHRVDAWTTSVASWRLADLRQPGQHPTGVLVGGYGWVTGLKWKQLAYELDPPPGEPQPLFKAEDNAGYVHAPSLRHATTAAILHAAYIARGGPAGRAGAVAVDLGAERVRLVARLLDGVQAGQSLGSVLGYRFERTLAEGGVMGVPQLIEPFRLLAPYRAQTLTPNGASAETSEPGAVVDGLALLDRWRGGGVPWGASPDPVGRPDAVLPVEGSDEYDLCVGALQGLADAVDALADAALAEGVHHLAAGNAARGGAALDAFAKGDAPPPDLDVVRTPRSGAVHTHRLMFLGTVNAAADVPVWPTDGRQVRAGLEPTLNGWAGALLGSPGRVRCRGVWRAPDGSVRASAEVTLADLRLSPLDLVCLAGGDRADRLYELRQRFVDMLRLKRPADVPEQPMPEPDFGRQADWAPQVLSVSELLSMASAVRAALLSARPVRGEDLAGPGDALPIAWNVTGMRTRTLAARTGLAQRRDALDTAVRARDIGPMGAGLVSLASYGLPGAMPEIGRDWTEAWRAELVAQGTVVVAEADRRLAADAALEAGFDAEGATPYAQVQHETERLRILLGEDFPVAPTWTLPAAAQGALTDLLAHGPALLDGDQVATGIWLDRLARVRAGVRRLREVLAHAEVTGAPSTGTLTIAQLPYVVGERWAALPPKTPGRREDRTALAVHTVRAVSATGEMTGLVFDEWTEMVPNAEETTAVTFHYDAPSARPPQSLLLAVPPAPTAKWSPEGVRFTVSAALDLAQKRTVDVPTMGEYGHFLPALYFALNISPSTVSTDLTGARA